MTFDHHDLGRSLLLASGLLLACTPTPVQLDSSTLGSESYTSDGGTTLSTSGPSTLDGTSDSADGTDSSSEETGPSFDPLCGDGIVEAPEECDLGPLNGSGMYCTSECTSNVCGDGYLGPGEACDDGNDNDEDQCTTQCGLATCGDGALQGAEECDEGANNSQTGSCLPSCILPTCGDLFIQAGVEMCDGTNIGGATCVTQGFDRGVLLCNATCNGFDTSNCYVCGNGIVEPNENCDAPAFDGLTCADFAPGGTTPSGGALACVNSCTTVDSDGCTYCGDGMREGTEVCDGNQFGGQTCANFAPGGTTPTGGALACVSNCTMINANGCTYCGDGVREGTEVCDGIDLAGQTCVSLGYGSGSLGCAASCMAFDETGCNTCGNGVYDPGEQCDGTDFNGATCGTVVGPGFRGPLACNPNCTIDDDDCCLSNDQQCTLDVQCCSGNCTNVMGTLRCQPA